MSQHPVNNIPVSTRQIRATSKIFGTIQIGAGLILSASLLLPAIMKGGDVLSPYVLCSTLDLKFKEGYLILGFLPVYYLFGFTTALFLFYGRLSKKGVTTPVLIIQTTATFFVMIGSGISLHLALLMPGKSFGMTFVGFALLAWWPIFFIFVANWFNFKQNFLGRLLLSTRLSALLNVIILAIITVDTLYYKERRVSYGLALSLVSSLILFLGKRESDR